MNTTTIPTKIKFYSPGWLEMPTLILVYRENLLSGISEKIRDKLLALNIKTDIICIHNIDNIKCDKYIDLEYLIHFILFEDYEHDVFIIKDYIFIDECRYLKEISNFNIITFGVGTLFENGGGGIFDFVLDLEKDVDYQLTLFVNKFFESEENNNGTINP